MSPSLELLVQFVGAVTNPFVIAAALCVPFLWPQPLAMRLGPAVTAGLFGVIDAAVGGALAWGTLLVAVSAAGGAAVGQAAQFVYVPLLAAALGGARRALAWLRGDGSPSGPA